MKITKVLYAREILKEEELEKIIEYVKEYYKKNKKDKIDLID